ncbi:MAG: hypothetical protein P8L71_11280, partial [Flavobacteriales bacterium]|nr:hypothetical protein [Flavobacteriales bacterium]
DNKENVINQGLFYLDWLMDHQANFEMLCMNKLGKSIEVDWSNPRLLCIAKDFTRYDDYAIGQINRNIELIRYRRFNDNSILFELAGTAQKTENNSKPISAFSRLTLFSFRSAAVFGSLISLKGSGSCFLF